MNSDEHNSLCMNESYKDWIRMNDIYMNESKSYLLYKKDAKEYFNMHIY
jgi:hypothetical protein